MRMPGRGIRLKYLDEASAWLSYDLISSCEDEHAGSRLAIRAACVSSASKSAAERPVRDPGAGADRRRPVGPRAHRAQAREVREQDMALDEVMQRYWSPGVHGPKPAWARSRCRKPSAAMGRAGSRASCHRPAKLVLGHRRKGTVRDRTIRIRKATSRCARICTSCARWPRLLGRRASWPSATKTTPTAPGRCSSPFMRRPVRRACRGRPSSRNHSSSRRAPRSGPPDRDRRMQLFRGDDPCGDA